MLFGGLEVQVTKCATERPWILPRERFFEWEEKDIPFCRKYRIGKPGPERPTAYIVGGSILVIHPDLWDELKKRIPRN